MALIRANTSGSGGGSKPFKILGYAKYDRGGTFTIPNDTDFVIVYSVFFDSFSSGTWHSVPPSAYVDEFTGILEKVGDSYSSSHAINSSQPTNVLSTEQTITWTSQTTVTATKNNYNAGYTIFACKYDS